MAAVCRVNADRANCYSVVHQQQHAGWNCNHLSNTTSNISM